MAFVSSLSWLLQLPLATALTCREQRPICLRHGWAIEATGGGLPGAWKGCLLARRQAGDVSNHEQS